MLASGLELGLNERDDTAAVREGADDWRQNQAQRDEGDIARREGGDERQVLGLHEAGVEALAPPDARIVLELLVELVVADIDGGHARRPVLEEAVGEAARRSADVEAVEPFHREAEVDEGPFELLAAATHEAGFRGERDLGVLGEGVARLCRGLAVHAHFASENKALRHFAALSEAARHDKLV